MKIKNTLWKLSIVTPAALGTALAISGNAFAIEAIPLEPAVKESTQLNGSIPEPVQLAQVTSVSELSDVQPGDWAFTALQRLVEEYGCLEGYPDRTYRGNRALTRYEFAAGLNACLDVVIQLIGPDSDLGAITRLQEEFAAELATIRGRVDTLETDVAELEANQFSTTTKLRGQLDAHLVVPFGDTTPVNDEVLLQGPSIASSGQDTTVGGPEADATFEYRARLNFDTSFTGEDRLRIRLQASDDAGSLANTEAGLYEQSGRRGGIEDNVGLDDVYYSFPIGNRISGIIAANSVLNDDFVTSTILPFGRNSVVDSVGPQFYDLYTGGDLGVGASFAFTDNLVLDVGYSSTTSNTNTPNGGIFNSYSYVAQLNLLTDGILDAAVAYLDGDQNAPGDPEYTIAGLLSLDFGRFIVAGQYAYTPATGGGDLDSYLAGIALPDFLGNGNELGVYGSISPSVNRDPLLVEAYYKMNVNEFFTLTPAVIYADNDSGLGDDNNFYGALRASFSF